MTMWVRSDMVRFHAVENSGQEKAEGEDRNCIISCGFAQRTSSNDLAV